jgi:hypothetical protein
MVFVHSNVQLVIMKSRIKNYDGARNVTVSVFLISKEVKHLLTEIFLAGRCKKVCGAANIDSIQSAQKLRGCTRIDGSLEIQIRSQGGRK